MRKTARFAAYFLAAATALLLVIVVTGSPSWSGVALTSGLFVLAVSALVERHARRVALAGVALVAATLLVRIATGNEGRDLRMYTAERANARVLNRLLDERDLAINAARALGAIQGTSWLKGHLAFASDPDAAVIADAMRRGYDRMRAEEGDVPSPVAATYLGLEAGGAGDIIEVGDPTRAPTTVIFLHGYAGGFTLPCWEVSRAATRAGMATVCPSIGWRGDWWTREGEAVLRSLVRDLRARGATRFILAGLSNGGVGATTAVARMPGVFSGIVAISGASGHVAAPSVPVLVLQGEHDAICPAAIARQYAAHAHAQYVSLDAGHFALLVRNEEAMDAMAAWLIRNAGRP